MKLFEKNVPNNVPQLPINYLSETTYQKLNSSATWVWKFHKKRNL